MDGVILINNFGKYILQVPTSILSLLFHVNNISFSFQSSPLKLDDWTSPVTPFVHPCSWITTTLLRPWRLISNTTGLLGPMILQVQIAPLGLGNFSKCKTSFSSGDSIHKYNWYATYEEHRNESSIYFFGSKGRKFLFFLKFGMGGFGKKNVGNQF